MDDASDLDNLPILQEESFVVTVRAHGYDEEHVKLSVLVNHLETGGAEPNPWMWKHAAACFMAMAAQRSCLGFEEALDRLRVEALQFRTAKNERTPIFKKDIDDAGGIFP